MQGHQLFMRVRGGLYMTVGWTLYESGGWTLYESGGGFYMRVWVDFI